MKNLSVVILAAGKGSRMKSDLSKAMHKIGNFTLLDHAIYKALLLEPKDVIVVLSPSMQTELDYIQKNYNSQNNSKIKIAIQKEPLGTANALLSAKEHAQHNASVLVLYVDAPLINHNSLLHLVSLIENKEALVSVLAFNATVPNSYGKLVVTNNIVNKIVEAKEANNQEINIELSNSGIMAFDSEHLWSLLESIKNNNSKQEYYLTDVIAIANSKMLVCKYLLADKQQLIGVNTKIELSEAEYLFQQQKRAEFLNEGVQLIDPQTVYFSLDTKIEKGVVIYPNVYIFQKVIIDENSIILPFTTLEGTHIKSNVSIGPFARIREGTVLENNSKIGNFVETKNAHIGSYTKVNHLSYIGDTVIGTKTNVGAGVITCNYDGINKFNTKIGNNVFIGSNNSIVAPITIGNNATTAAGSTIVESVEDNALAIARSRQTNKANWRK